MTDDERKMRQAVIDEAAREAQEERDYQDALRNVGRIADAMEGILKLLQSWDRDGRLNVAADVEGTGNRDYPVMVRGMISSGDL